jgi:GH24 family phage-related lysozyme (muramidase)
MGNRFLEMDAYLKKIKGDKNCNPQTRTYLQRNAQSLNKLYVKSFERTQTWSLSQQGVDLIKGFEGFRANMYNDAAGHCTIGYGTLLHHGNCNGAASEQPYMSGVTNEQATQLLLQRANEFQRMINNSVTVELNQNQYDSLVSLAYNIGSGAFQQSTLLRVLNLGQYNNVPSEMRKWTKATVDGQKVDLPGLVTRRNAEATLFSTPVSTSQSFTVYPMSTANSIENYSQPFYDTGEHAILGTTHYQTLPSKLYTINNVKFTYGQIMTLGDFYETYNDLVSAPQKELEKVIILVKKSEEFYKKLVFEKINTGKNVKSTDWSGADGIGPRYIDLALLNNSHFAPPAMGASSSKANNKKTWEEYHTKVLLSARGNDGTTSIVRTSVDELDALYPMNAFGDHFLTDAFSAGHLINKELVMDKFKANVLTSGKVNSVGEKMFEKIANGALKNKDVDKTLGKFKTVAFPYLSLNSTFPVNVFYNVLVGVIEDKKGTDKISNLAAIAAHDYLNTYSKNGENGVPVKNKKGQTWNLLGDGTLDKDIFGPMVGLSNLEVIQLAVKQSIDNIEDAVRDASIPIPTFCKKVWDYVPDLTHKATADIVKYAVDTFTDPQSDLLIKKAIALIGEELETLLDALVTAGKIERK